MARPRGKKVTRRHMMLSDESVRQIEALSREFGMTKSKIVRKAVERWYRVEFPQPSTKD